MRSAPKKKVDSFHFPSTLRHIRCRIGSSFFFSLSLPSHDLASQLFAFRKNSKSIVSVHSSTSSPSQLYPCVWPPGGTHLIGHCLSTKSNSFWIDLNFDFFLQVSIYQYIQVNQVCLVGWLLKNANLWFQLSAFNQTLVQLKLISSTRPFTAQS